MSRYRSLSAALVASLLVACTATPTPPPAASPTPTPAPTETATAILTPPPTTTPTATPTGSVRPTDALGPFICDATIVLPAVGTGQATTTAVRVGLQPGYDRLVFAYAGALRPQFTVNPVVPPFALDPSGLPLTVQGTQFARIRLDGIVVGYKGATSFRPGGPFIVDVERQGELEGEQSLDRGPHGGRLPTGLRPDRSEPLGRGLRPALSPAAGRRPRFSDGRAGSGAPCRRPPGRWWSPRHWPWRAVAWPRCRSR